MRIYLKNQKAIDLLTQEEECEHLSMGYVEAFELDHEDPSLSPLMQYVAQCQHLAQVS